MAFDAPQPDETPETLPPGTPPPPREPRWVTVLGIALFLSFLTLIWGNALAQRTQRTGAQDTLQARLTTYQVAFLWHRSLAGGTMPGDQLVGSVPVTARTAARQWDEVSRNAEIGRAQETAPVDQAQQTRTAGLAALNAAALNGVAGDLAAARGELDRASAVDPEHAPQYAEYRPIYEDTPRPVTLSPEATALLGEITAGPLLQAGNALARGDTGVAVAVLAPAAQAGLRLTTIGGMLTGLAVLAGLVGLGIFLGLLISLLKRRSASPEAHAARAETMAARDEALATRWGIGAALLAVTLYNVVGLGLGLALTALYHAGGGRIDIAIAVLFQSLGTLVGLVIVAGTLLTMTGYGFWEWRALGWRNPGGIRTGILGLLGALPLFALLLAISTWLFGNESHPIAPTLYSVHAIWLQVLLFAAVAVVAPVVEETFFRGILFRAMGSTLPVWPAMFISGAIFAAVHGQPNVLLPFTVLGATFAYVVWRTRGIWAAVAAHAVFNGVQVLAALLIASSLPQ